jgi:thioesterase domain-containing protein
LKLVRMLNVTAQIYGLQGWRDARNPFATDVAALAEIHLNAIRAHQPQGPYYLAGWSFGGIVAFEIAQRLRAAGESVPMLILFDSACPRGEQVSEEQVAEELASAMLSLVEGTNLMTDADAALTAASKLERYFSIASARNLLPPSATLEDVLSQARVTTAFLVSMRRYVPKSYPGRIILVRTQEAVESRGGADLGWSQWVGDRLEIHEVPGTHAAMMTEPAVAQVVNTALAAMSTQRGQP